MAEISEDIILEILSFLPLKLLVRFKYLNKRLHQSISAPFFQNRRAVLRSFTGYECIFHKILRIDLPRGENSYSSVQCHSSHSNIPIILASSGGLLLLHLPLLSKEYICRYCHSIYTFCLFNPATGAYQIIQPHSYKFSGVGLVLNVVVSLVFVIYSTNCVFLIYESESKRWHQTSTNLKRELFISPAHREAYYLNGSLYWLTFGGQILTFNVKTEVAETINLPEASRSSIATNPSCVNFGAIRDELALITGDANNKVFLHIYDFINGKWKIDRIFESGISSPIQSSIILPLFCDGNQLILARILNGETIIQGIRGNNSKENIAIISKRSIESHKFRHFLGTLTEIPNCQYLVNGLKGMRDHTRVDDDELRLKMHFEDLLCITKGCSFLE